MLSEKEIREKIRNKKHYKHKIIEAEKILKSNNKTAKNQMISYMIINFKAYKNIIKKFSNEINWDEISWGHKLSENFICEFQDKVNWYWVSYYQILSEDFIKKFVNKVHWANISSKQKLSEDFILEFYDKVDWDYISRKQNITKKLFERMNREQKLYMLINHREIWEKYVK